MDQNGNGNGHATPRRWALVLEYDEATHQVGIGGDPMPLALAQMIVDEGARVLSEQRRLAQVQAIQATAARQAEAAAVAARIRNRG